jgi:hypothetical protein
MVQAACYLNISYYFYSLKNKTNRYAEIRLKLIMISKKYGKLSANY